MFSKLLGDAYDVENPQACYDETLLTPLSLSKIFSGSRIGPGKPDVAISFKRNLEGKLDPNGTYSKQKIVLQVKYDKEGRWTYGVYMDANGAGHKIKPIFEYTEKKLITHVDRHKLRLQATGFARSKQGTPLNIWTEANCPEGDVYANESIMSLPKLKKKTFYKLQLQGITLVKHLKALAGDTVQTKVIVAASPGISLKRLTDFIQVAEACLEAANNPYESQFGDLWEEEIDKVCMTGQHDLMVPSGGIGGNLAHYHNRPVGNRPEASPLDTSLFSQLHHAVNLHVHITSTLPDKVKFSKATPSALSSAYKQVWQVHPKPETVAKDINKVLRSLQIIADHEGLAVDGIGDRKGRRHISKSQLGGKRVRRLTEDCYDQGKIELHEDAALAPAAIIHKAELKFETQEELDDE
eukprot:jgi/Psemu1/27654/gm1.27654_g